MDEGWHDMALVGRVARPHGNRGQIIVNPETDFPDERFRQGERLFVRVNDRIEARRIEDVRFQQARPVLALEGIDSIDAAERLRGAELRIPAAELAALPAGTFYRHDLVGCRVVTREGQAIGTVREVRGEADTSRLIVAGAGGEIDIPLAAEICVRIDPGQREIVIAPPEGLIELNRP